MVGRWHNKQKNTKNGQAAYLTGFVVLVAFLLVVEKWCGTRIPIAQEEGGSEL